ncbi:hypothetical protein JCM19992_09050 [Thermostilla marina]
MPAVGTHMVTKSTIASATLLVVPLRLDSIAVSAIGNFPGVSSRAETVIPILDPVRLPISRHVFVIETGIVDNVKCRTCVAILGPFKPRKRRSPREFVPEGRVREGHRVRLDRSYFGNKSWVIVTWRT